MLTAYLARTNLLLQNPAPATALYSTADLTSYINQARGQLAGETECCRYLGTISTTIDQRNYNFSGISTGVAATTGVQGAINVRAIRYAVGDGYQWIRPRPWPWFDLFCMNNPVPASGAPERWAQYGQGSAGAGSMTGIGTGTMVSGSFWLDPIPDLAYVLTCDLSCYPIAMTADTDVEAIPYLFTDAIPYYAAYLALMSDQTNARLDTAMKYFEIYDKFVQRANRAGAPNVNRYLYERQSDPTQINKVGVQKSVGDGAQ